MTPAALVLLAFAGAAALVDWVAVARSAPRLEYAAKPAALLFLVAAALLIRPADPVERVLFVAAFAGSLAGDVFLMLPSDHFVAGLASFLVAHLFFIAGFAHDLARRGGAPLARVALAAGAVAILAVFVGGRVLLALRDAGKRNLLLPVVLYLLALSTMTVCALASGRPAAAAGGLLFLASDAMIAWHRFVRPRPAFPLAIIVTYHLAQAGLLLALL